MKIIGIRPGEKLHETMCPLDDSHLTLEFNDHYIIKPTITFTKSISYKTNKIREKGKQVKEGFQYSSETNKKFLSIKEIIKINKSSGF